MRFLIFILFVLLFTPRGFETVFKFRDVPPIQHPPETPEEIAVADVASSTPEKPAKIVAEKKVVPPAPRPTLPPPAVVKDEPRDPAADLISLIESEVLRRSNEERIADGLSPLAQDTRLRQIAWSHSADMFANEYFSHEDTVGCSSSCRATNAGYAWRSIGENIYMMSGYDDAPETKARRVVEGWMNSPGHRANILGKYTVSGVGVVSAGESVYVTALYATPR